MAARSPVVDEEGRCGFSSALSSAVSEWFLMLLLFLNGFVSYLVTKFAHFCKLQTPCLFCSRLDHLVNSEKPDFYKNLICDSHKREISSLAYCHVHRRLADVREMCETCLLSFATEKKSNQETYRSLVGKLEINLDNEERTYPKLPETIDIDGSQNKSHGEDTVQVPLLNNHALGFLRKRHCSCCQKHFRMKSHAHRLLQTKSIAAEIAEPDRPVLSLTGRDRPEPRDALSKRKEISWKPPTSSHEGNNGFDRLSHVGYTELKITSDSESEVLVSDDDDDDAGHGLHRESNDSKEKFMSQYLQPEIAVSEAIVSSRTLSGEVVPDKLIHTAPVTPVIKVTVPDKQANASELSNAASLAPSTTLAHDLEEHNLNEARGNAPLPQSDSVPHQSPLKVVVSQNVLEVGDVTCVPSSAVGDVPCVSSNAIDVMAKTLSPVETTVKRSQDNSDPAPSFPSILELSDAYKLAIGSKGSEPSPSPRDPSRAQEDLRLLLTHISTARGLDFPWNDMTPSPRVHVTGEESKFVDSAGSCGLQNITKRFSLERNESGFSSLDGSAFSEIEGESAVDRLKRQVEWERKSLILLYKELEEERSASAIAANQAMAMITRLQEEKAAMHMEALQYQRMMEEQAEYDQEVLQKSNDLLAQREREVQDLEAEIATYRKRFLDECKYGETLSLISDTDERETSPIRRHHEWQSVGGRETGQTNMDFLDSEGEKTSKMKYSLLEFEDEKLYISKCLRNLEKKLLLFSNNGVYTDMYKLDDKEGVADAITENGEYYEKGTCRKENISTVQSVFCLSGENSHSSTPDTTQSVCTENHKDGSSMHNSNNEKQHSMGIERERDIESIETEISRLNAKLEALEADRSFLEHTMNSLKNGNEGIRFVREIAHHLQKLREIGSRRSEQMEA